MRAMFLKWKKAESKMTPRFKHWKTGAMDVDPMVRERVGSEPDLFFFAARKKAVFPMLSVTRRAKKKRSHLRHQEKRAEMGLQSWDEEMFGPRERASSGPECRLRNRQYVTPSVAVSDGSEAI